MHVWSFQPTGLRITLMDRGELVEVHTMAIATLLISEGARFVAMSGRLRGARTRAA